MSAPTSLYLRQKVTVMVNQYWVHGVDPAGQPGPVLAFAQQKRMKLREEVTFYADEGKSQVLFGFKSRQVIDMAATTDVFDVNHAPIGVFSKDAMKSLLNSTWHIQSGPISATGRERSDNVALVRRFGGFVPLAGDLLELVPWQFHFDFVDAAGANLLSVERQRKVRDHYRLTLRPDAAGNVLDWRFAATLGVALDAFQGR